MLGNGRRERWPPGPGRIWLKFGTPHQLRQAEKGRADILCYNMKCNHCFVFNKLSNLSMTIFFIHAKMDAPLFLRGQLISCIDHKEKFSNISDLVYE